MNRKAILQEYQAVKTEYGEFLRDIIIPGNLDIPTGDIGAVAKLTTLEGTEAHVRLSAQGWEVCFQWH